jgi:hypothetical protein
MSPFVLVKNMIYNKDVNFAEPQPLDQNQSFALPQRFRMVIDGQRYKNVLFTLQRLEIPDISATAAPMALPQRNIGFSPDKLTYTDLNVTFLISEDFSNYIEIHDWIYGATTQPDSPGVDKYKDISLLILSSHNNVIREFKFTKAFPVSLSAVSLDATSLEADYMVATAVFNYSYFKIS